MSDNDHKSSLISFLQRSNKFDRIQFLRELGLNTQVSVVIHNVDDLKRHREFLEKSPRYSIRSFWKMKSIFYPDFKPIVPREWIDENAPTLLSKGLNLIIAEPIDPNDAVLAGCIVRHGSITVIEIANGPVTVRRVTHEGYVDERYLCYGHLPYTSNLTINLALSNLREAELLSEIAFEASNFEFSYYPYGVGWLSKPLIFWEVDFFEPKNIESWLSNTDILGASWHQLT